MRHIIYTISFLILFSCSNKQQPSSVSLKKDSIFAPMLKTEIERLIKVRKQHYSSSVNRFYTVLLTRSNHYEDGRDQCIVILALTTTIDSQQITGYTFVDKEPIACYILSDTCYKTMIDKDLLLTNRDSIRKYFMAEEPLGTGNYEVPTYVYKVINNDSLSLIKKRGYYLE